MRAPALVLLCVAAVAQPVQEPPSRDITKLLASEQASDLAWAAHLAAQSEAKQYVSDITRLLERERRTDDDRKVPLYALETLIQFEAEVPEKLLEPLAHEYFDFIAVLLRRDVPGHVALLLRLLDNATTERERWVWTRVLGSHPTPEYTVLLYRAWTVQATMQVQDTGAATLITSSGFQRDYGCEGAMFQNSTGKFPPRPAHFGGDLCIGSVVDTDEEGAWYFRKIVPGLAPPRGWLEYRDTEQVRREAGTLRLAAERYLDTLRTKLIASGFLPSTEATRPRVAYRIVDNRRDKSVPLPDVGGLLP
jgi:hypothetical protein